jgi:hypothetical protein
MSPILAHLGRATLCVQVLIGSMTAAPALSSARQFTTHFGRNVAPPWAWLGGRAQVAALWKS